MKTFSKYLVLVFGLLLAASVIAQDDAEQLKVTAIEALISAPPERAMPLVQKVLAGNSSDRVKEKALFILSQIDDPEAQATLVRVATEANGELQQEAIRMIGIGGDPEALRNLDSIYQQGDTETREAVLEALMIAGDKRAVFNIALKAEGEDFEEAVDMLGAMDALDELRELRAQKGMSEALIDAYAISGDLASLRELALDASDPEMQAQAIESMGIIGGDEVDTALVQIYRDADSELVREAALDGMLISGHDKGVLELYRSSTDTARKKELLEMLVIMDSDEVWDVIDATLEEEL
jgi:HEAT repeat protein